MFILLNSQQFSHLTNTNYVPFLTVYQIDQHLVCCYFSPATFEISTLSFLDYHFFIRLFFVHTLGCTYSNHRLDTRNIDFSLFFHQPFYLSINKFGSSRPVVNKCTLLSPLISIEHALIFHITEQLMSM